MSDQEMNPPLEDTTGVDPRFHEVIQTHSRALWVLVFNANMAWEALAQVMHQAEKHHSGALQHAGQVLSAILAEQGLAYCNKMGWTQEQIDDCARDILLAVQEQRIQLLN